MPKIVAKKKDWIKLGFKLFSQKGISGIIIEKMALKLNVNKSSFYWHFKTKKDFINAIMEYWVYNDTQKIISKVEKCINPRDKFNKLIELAFKKDPHLDFMFHLKRYSQTNKHIFEITNSIEIQRINYVKEILINMKFSKEAAEIKANLFYKYLIGYHEMIRYTKQNKEYIREVKMEINQFIKHKL